MGSSAAVKPNRSLRTGWQQRFGVEYFIETTQSGSNNPANVRYAHPLLGPGRSVPLFEGSPVISHTPAVIWTPATDDQDHYEEYPDPGRPFLEQQYPCKQRSDRSYPGPDGIGGAHRKVHVDRQSQQVHAGEYEEGGDGGPFEILESGRLLHADDPAGFHEACADQEDPGHGEHIRAISVMRYAFLV